jgi:hypothetical protein
MNEEFARIWKEAAWLNQVTTLTRALERLMKTMKNLRTTSGKGKAIPVTGREGK